MNNEKRESLPVEEAQRSNEKKPATSPSTSSSENNDLTLESESTAVRNAVTDAGKLSTTEQIPGVNCICMATRSENETAHKSPSPVENACSLGCCDAKRPALRTRKKFAKGLRKVQLPALEIPRMSLVSDCYDVDFATTCACECKTQEHNVDCPPPVAATGLAWSRGSDTYAVIANQYSINENVEDSVRRNHCYNRVQTVASNIDFRPSVSRIVRSQSREQLDNLRQAYAATYGETSTIEGTTEAVFEATVVHDDLMVVIAPTGIVPLQPQNVTASIIELEHKNKKLRVNIALVVGMLLLATIGIFSFVPNVDALSGNEDELTPAASPSPNHIGPNMPWLVSSTSDPALMESALVDLIQSRSLATSFDDRSSSQSQALAWLLANINCTLQGDSSEYLVQRFALATLCYGLHGMKCNPEGWVQSIEQCSCMSQDVSLAPCDANKFIAELSIQGAGLSGEIPREIGLLTRLEKIDLYDNLLIGSLPAELFQLSKLTSLVLAGNKLSGLIPAALSRLVELQDLNMVGNMLNGSIPFEIFQMRPLRKLLLSQNEVTGTIPPQVANLEDLNVLDLDENFLAGSIPSELGLLTNLKRLNIWGNPWEGVLPFQIGGLIELTEFWAGDNELTGSIPSTMGRLTKLTAVSFSSSSLSGTIPSELGLLTMLTELSLYNNVLRGSIPSELFQLVRIQQLELDLNELTGTISEEVGLLSDMRSLDLDGNHFIGRIPSTIGLLTAVTKVSLYDNQLQGSIPSEIGELASVSELWLNLNELTGVLPTTLGACSQLRRLEVDRNDLTGTVPTELGQLVQLSVLAVYDNALRGVIPSELGQLTELTALLATTALVFEGQIPTELGHLSKLTEFEFDSINVGGRIPSQLGLLTELTRLTLNGNSLTGEIPTELGSLTRLRYLFLQGNFLSGRIPTELSQLTKLDFLWLFDNRLSGSISESLCPAVVPQIDCEDVDCACCRPANGATSC